MPGSLPGAFTPTIPAFASVHRNNHTAHLVIKWQFTVPHFTDFSIKRSNFCWSTAYNECRRCWRAGAHPQASPPWWPTGTPAGRTPPCPLCVVTPGAGVAAPLGRPSAGPRSPIRWPGEPNKYRISGQSEIKRKCMIDGSKVSWLG